MHTDTASCKIIKYLLRKNTCYQIRHVMRLIEYLWSYKLICAVGRVNELKSAEFEFSVLFKKCAGGSLGQL